MKKNRLFMLGIVTVFVAILSLTLVSSTFAKYTSTVTGDDSARVAKWAWTFNTEQLDLGSAQEVTTFGLFDTIKDTAGATEEDVNSGLIAPGTSGSFSFVITNSSEVTGEYTVNFDSSEVVEQIEYSLDGSSWVEEIEDLTKSEQLEAATEGNPITVYWRWEFEGNDTSDTADGIAGNVEHSVTITILFEQVD